VVLALACTVAKPIGTCRQLLARYLPDGAADGDFGADGTVPVDLGGSPGGYTVFALAVQPDGRPVVAGETYRRDSGHHAALARYLP
jgi:Domain of unknown function (DUF5122) beta-propeller